MSPSIAAPSKEEEVLMATILIVDDDEMIRDALYELLESEHRCHVAETANKAVAWLESESYDVVLTDISMPGLGGGKFMVLG